MQKIRMRWEALPERSRRFGAIRSSLIGYGVLAFTVLWSRSDALSDGSSGAGGSGRSWLLWGVGVQILMILAGRLIRRQSPDAASAEQGLMILELVGDAVTVALFATATFGAIMSSVASI
jgi:hypothetical protein